jgi:hypothetical protein
MRLYTLAPVLLMSLLTGCAMSRATTGHLAPGLSPAQVRTLLGAPQQASAMRGRVVWQYAVSHPPVGDIPYYLVFADKGQRLEGWSALPSEGVQNPQAAALNRMLLHGVVPRIPGAAVAPPPGQE